MRQRPHGSQLQPRARTLAVLPLHRLPQQGPFRLRQQPAARGSVLRPCDGHRRDAHLCASPTLDNLAGVAQLSTIDVRPTAGSAVAHPPRSPTSAARSRRPGRGAEIYNPGTGISLIALRPRRSSTQILEPGLMPLAWQIAEANTRLLVWWMDASSSRARRWRLQRRGRFPTSVCHHERHWLLTRFFEPGPDFPRQYSDRLRQLQGQFRSRGLPSMRARRSPTPEASAARTAKGTAHSTRRPTTARNVRQIRRKGKDCRVDTGSESPHRRRSTRALQLAVARRAPMPPVPIRPRTS